MTFGSHVSFQVTREVKGRRRATNVSRRTLRTLRTTRNVAEFRNRELRQRAQLFFL